MAKRRANREGTGYQRADGRWEWKISLPNGRRKSFYGATQAEARRKATAALAALDRGRLPANEAQTVAGYLDLWLADMEGRVRPRTLRGYQQHVRDHIAPAVGGVRLARLAPDHVRAMMRDVAKKGLSARTVASIRGTLRHALAQALRDGLVDRNAAALAEPPKVLAPKRRALTVAGAKELVAAVDDDRIAPAVVVALLTGLRQGEQLGLHWTDVDLDAGTMTVRRALQRKPGAGLVEVEPKTAASRRMVALPGAAVSALRRQRAQQGRERLAAGERWHTTGYVFTTEVGTPIDGPRLTRRFRLLQQAAGLNPIRWHDLRHGTASLMLALGVPTRTVSEALGHASTATTSNVYQHVPTDLLRDAAARLDDALGLG